MLRNIRLIFITFILLSSCSHASAQSGRKTVQQSSLWLSASAQVQVHKHFGIVAESVVRLSEFQRNQQHEFHIGAEVYINNNWIIAPIGYGYFLNYVYGKLPAAVQQNEHRIWQQVMYRNNFCRLNVNIRLRAEENWREMKLKDANGNFYVADYTFKVRLRARVITNVALNTHSWLAPKTVFLSMWDEMYVAVGPEVVSHLPEENRAHIGLGYRFAPWGVVTAGYMHQLILRNNATQAESNHTMVVHALFQINVEHKKPTAIKQ